MVSSRTSAFVSIFAMVALLVGTLMLAIRVIPLSSGAIAGVTTNGYTTDGAVVYPLPGADTPFEAADVVTAIAGSSLTSLPVEPGSVPTQAGATVPATVVRGDQELALVVPLQPYPLPDFLVSAAGTMTFALVLFAGAAYVFRRRPRDAAAIGLLIFSLGVVASTPAYLAGIDPLSFARGTMALAWFPTVLLYYLIWAGGLHFALVFPRPHPWVDRRPAAVLLPYILVYAILGVGALLSFGAGLEGLAPLAAFDDVGNVITLVAMIGFIALMIRSWVRAGAEDRRMLRGLVVTGLLAVVGGVLLQYLPSLLADRPILPWGLAGLLGVPFALALAAAVLRHGAFDIDVVVDRSLVYGGMTAGVLLVYVFAATALGTVLKGDAEYAVALLATALAALVALPLRDGLQRVVDRALYGDRDEPVRAIRRLGERLALTADPSSLPRVIVDTVADALRSPFVALEIGPPGDAVEAARHGQEPADPADVRELELMAGAADVGRLRVGTREPGEPLSNADLQLLEDLARQLGPAINSIALNAALQRSRERIVAVGEEERRRLRRDLHDGLGPELAAIGMRAEAASSLLVDDPSAARRLLDEVAEGARSAVDDVRHLVEGLRPPSLDELGLVGAIEQQAERLAVERPVFVVESPAPPGPLPAAVEVAAYRIAVEAMTNVVRHADAQRCRVDVAADGAGPEPRLTLEIVDDGRGLGPDPRPGVGLTSMQERAAEVGGEVIVSPRAEGGTRVWASLPVGGA